MRKHQVPVAMRPVKTLKSLLVHSKDKQEKEEVTDCAYKIPWARCEKRYIGETGRKFGTRLKEHQTEVESLTSKPFTRNQRASSLSEQNKSALTDHASHDNPVIDWPASTILDRESDKSTRLRKHCVRWGPNSPSTKSAQPTPNFRPMSIVGKQLDGLRCHFVYSRCVYMWISIHLTDQHCHCHCHQNTSSHQFTTLQVQLQLNAWKYLSLK